MEKSNKIGLSGTVALVFSGMVGAGILVLPTIMAGFGPISFFGWILSFIMAYSIFRSFLNVQSAYIKNNPQSINPSVIDFLRMKFCDNTVFLINLIYFVALTCSGSVISNTVGKYFIQLFPLGFFSLELASLIGICFIITLFIMNLINSKLGDYLNQFLSIIKFVFFTIIAICGCTFYQNYNFASIAEFSINENFVNLFKSASCGMFAFLGIEFAIFSAGSIENPEENVPKGTFIGLVCATFVFVGMYAAALFLVKDVATCPAPVSMAAQQIFGNFGGVVVGIVAVLSCITTLIGVLLVQGNIFRNLANKNLLPKYFANEKNGFPWVGALIALMISIFWISVSVWLKSFGIEIPNMSVIFIGIMYSSIVMLDFLVNGISFYAILALISSLIMFSNINLSYCIIIIIVMILGFLMKNVLGE